MRVTTEPERLLQICRSVMPGVAGVVLATLGGHVVAHEPDRVRDPGAVATEAMTHASAEVQTSALVDQGGALYLVVFVPPPLVDQIASCGPGALTA